MLARTVFTNTIRRFGQLATCFCPAVARNQASRLGMLVRSWIMLIEQAFSMYFSTILCYPSGHIDVMNI